MFIAHGHQYLPWDDLETLKSIQRVNDVDIVVTAHTHTQSIREDQGVYFINPGSATGASNYTGG